MLQHPNIVLGYDVNTFSEPPYVAMECVEGVSLRQKLKETGKVSEPEAVAILKQILAALDNAHKNGVMHRDLKPENVLVTATGVVKITDFGLGKLPAGMDQSMRFSTSIDKSQIVGTIDYMSPQQKSGFEADVRDDLYSVGIIACELLTGSRPLPIGVSKMLQQAGVDHRIVPWLERALEENPGQRFCDALEMNSALVTTQQSAIAPTTNPSGQPDAPTQESQVPKTHRLSIRIMSAIATVVVVVAALYLWLGPPNDKVKEITLPDGQPGLEIKIDEGMVIRFARIESGTFTMGSPITEEGRSEIGESEHQVQITKPFCIAVCEVTQEQYNRVMGDNPSHFKGERLPVENVTWYDATEFCNKLSKKTKLEFRLPTEAEWEYACRAGMAGPYAGNGRLEKMGWYADNSGKTSLDAQGVWETDRENYGRRIIENDCRTHEVGTKTANSWGLHDMHGNVWEWCSNWYDNFTPDGLIDPTGPSSGVRRVLRGGSWNYDRRFCRSACRYSSQPETRRSFFGFRIALNVP